MPAEGAVTEPLDLAAALAGLRTLEAFADTPAGALEPLRVKGLFHDHVRIAGTPWILRIPRASQFGLPPAENLAYQTACFARAAASGHTPALAGTIAPRTGLAYGALVVAFVPGGPARLPGDMPAIARCLAAIHALPVPDAGGRAPLAVHADAVAGILGFIEAQAAYLDRAGIGGAARREIADELDWARSFAATLGEVPQPLALCATDTHPGNFLVETAPAGGRRAAFVDLEKALYGSPAIDLAHASLPTSTMWDADCAALLDRAAVRGFYAAWLESVPAGLGAAARPWLVPMRRLTWLRTTTWFAKWRVEAAARSAARGGGASDSDWWRLASRAPEQVAEVARRIDGLLDPGFIARARAEWLGPDRLDLSD